MSVNSLNDIWQAVLGVLGEHLTDTAISTWFEDCEPVEINGSTLVLKTSSHFKRDIIVNRFFISKAVLYPVEGFLHNLHKTSCANA